jgi:hypothetical protein
MLTLGHLAMNDLRRATVMAAAVLAFAAVATQATADGRRDGSHAPIYVATPGIRSPITPYFFPYGGRYRYNSPGPVYERLALWHPHYGCRLWRYNYLYWTC